ncbi:amidohydrolase family protein [soil metagenome]
MLGYGAATGLALRRLPPGALAGVASPSSGAVDVVLDRPTPDQPTPALAGAPEQPAEDHVYDLVVSGGRLIDPESGFDDVAHVGVDGGFVTAVSREPLRGRRAIDARDRVVAPGFIDILSYEPNSYGIWYKVADGVTTNLGMHGINARAADFLARFDAEGSPCHYGGAYDNPFMRGDGGLGVGTGEACSPAQIASLTDDLRQQLADGWIVVDVEPEYTPGIAYDEIAALAAVAADAGVACFFHGRYSDDRPPGTNADTLGEILQVARDTGAGVHVQHLTSTGGTFTMERSLATLDAAVAEGLDVTACMYPYTFWATFLGSARFTDGWQERFRVGYDDLEVVGTGERLTAANFEDYRSDNVLVAAHAIPAADVVAGLRSPLVMLGSDAILEPGDRNHPRATGCFARTLGRFVRDQQVLSLSAALAKMTILPARRFGPAVPAMARKGRLQRGADADICVFDPATVSDRSTLSDPARESVGIDWVVVAGQIVKDPDTIHRDVLPGRPITMAT